ncbi:MAG: M16 family metallopeptidase [Erysipelotrichaceae bacterium]
MITYENKKLNEKVTETTLDNGLKVFFIHKPGFISSTAVYMVPFGSLDIRQQKPDGEIIESNAGVAHFLEHKLFESNNGTDIMEAFSAMSANVNAFTSYYETCYYFSTGEADFSHPLELLLDFVQNLSITDESVEKEKGIIIQELRMYMQMPEARLMYETYRSLFKTHPVRIDIGGSEESVKAITKAELYDLYEANYHPSNSVLVIVSGQESEKILDLVKDNQAGKTFPDFEARRRLIDMEELKVAKKHHSFAMDIQAKKITYSFKFNPAPGTRMDRLVQEWMIRIYLELLFSSYNPLYQNWLDSNRINDYFGYEVDVTDEYGFVMFYGEKESEEDLVALVNEGLSTDFATVAPYFDNLKKRYFGQAIRSLNNPDDMAVSFARCVLLGLDYFETLDCVNQIEVGDLMEIGGIFDPAHSSIVSVRSKKA